MKATVSRVSPKWFASDAYLTTFHLFNYVCFACGLIIVWLASHIVWAIVGTIIASGHWTQRWEIKEEAVED